MKATKSPSHALTTESASAAWRNCRAHYTTGEYDLFLKIYAYNNHHLMSVIHDKLMPLGLSRSESSISYNAVIDRTLPIEGMKVADVVLEDDEEEEE